MQPTPTPRRGRRGPVLAVLALLVALPVLAVGPATGGGSSSGDNARDRVPLPASFEIRESRGHDGRGRDCPFKHKQQREQSNDDGV
jgi:hypothetical protein